jgi:hypothetical protein
MIRPFVALLLAAVSAPAAWAQTPSPCEPPALRAASREQNIFTDEQERDLGDAVAEHLQHQFRVIDDAAVTGYLERIGSRIVAQIPKTGLQFRFFLVELPDANAFVLPGGRVYVSRKLVAQAQTEDELAGVIAHEAGHIVARHGSIRMTRLFREVLGVTAVTDRKDIFEKYNRLVENAGRKPKAFEAEDDHGDADQLTADLIGLYALARAGYDPAAFSRFFDRIAETKGKTGNFFSNVFGTTNPEQKRLREMIKTAQALPPSCVSTERPAKPEEFVAWRDAVVAYTGAGTTAALHGVKTKIVLEPPLRGELTQLRFSPDGKYVLAQDEAGVCVLTRDPFAFVFRIDAPDASPARFTADSRSVVVHTPTLRVETWDVASQKLAAAHELLARTGWLQTLLSPDAKVLAVLDGDLNLTLVDTASGSPIFQKKEFYTPNPIEILLLRLLRAAAEEAEDAGIDWINMDFSPDGHFFAAGARSAYINAGGGISSEASAIAVDLMTRQTVGLKGQLKKMLAGGFAFVGPAKVVGINGAEPAKSGFATFPAGEVVDTLPLASGTPTPAAAGNYLLVRPAGQYPVAVMDVAAKKFFKANKQSAFDVYNQQFVSERRNGEVGLYGLEKNDQLATVTLPKSPLGRLRAVALSPDFSWLAVSGRLRGALWSLTSGERLFYVRGFRGGYFGPDGALYADFPKFQADARTVMRLDPVKREATNGPALEESGPRQAGPYLLWTKAAGDDGDTSENVTTEVLDARTLAVLWSRKFPKEAPRTWLAPELDSLALVWPLASAEAKAAVKADARLAPKFGGLKDKEVEGDYLVEVLEAKTGKSLGRLVVQTGKGSFRIADVFVAGDSVCVADSENRVLVYSLATGELKGRVFGGQATASAGGRLLCAQNEAGKLAVYDLATLERRDEFAFGSPVVLTQFSADGASLFVLTASQEAYVMDVAAK